jgi:hypothetical protein
VTGMETTKSADGTVIAYDRTGVLTEFFLEQRP